jgi:hypothetical protein
MAQQSHHYVIYNYLHNPRPGRALSHIQYTFPTISHCGVGSPGDKSQSRARHNFEPASPFASQRLAGILESGVADDALRTAASGAADNGQGSLRREGLHKLQQVVWDMVTSTAEERRQRRSARQQPDAPPLTTPVRISRAHFACTVAVLFALNTLPPIGPVQIATTPHALL